MLKTRFGDYELSRLMLGTAQFGLPYGIANKVGQPSYEAVRDIIAVAFEGGVNCFDTAPLYGTSEEILGKILGELGLKNRVVVETKVAHMADDYSSLRVVDETVENCVVQSLKRLRLEILPLCIFHAEKNFRYIDSLLKCRERGLVKYVGSSVMTPAATQEIIRSGLAEVVQVPTNILDHRYLNAGIFQEAAKRNMAVFVRSIYLQGLVLQEELAILPELAEVIPIRRRLMSLAADAGMSLAELAIRYVLTIDGTTCGVIGLETAAQMEENIELFNKGPLAPDLFQAATALVPDLPDKVLMPNQWSKRMPDVKPQRR